MPLKEIGGCADRRVARVQARCASFFRRPSIGLCWPMRWSRSPSAGHTSPHAFTPTMCRRWKRKRNRLRGVGATLRSATLAMLNDGVGAAVAGANELQSVGGIARASSAELSSTLQKQLTGGEYVRFLFLADNGRFALASRERASDSRTPPDWLTTNRAGSSNSWVGKPMVDPERPGELVIPVAQRVASGASSTAWAGSLIQFRWL